MDLKTKYLGLTLKNPIIPSASPLSTSVDTARRLEDAGASAIVMCSLFEEQINHDVRQLDHMLTSFSDSSAEALSYFPEPEQYHNLEAEEYLDQLRKLKKNLSIPVIGSLNGVSPGGWMQYAKWMEEAGADAIELNIYYIATDPATTAEEVEQLYIDDVRTVKHHVKIPVSVKLGPYFSSFANMAVRLNRAGADGLVLFNRFYQPDIDLEKLSVSPNLTLSTSFEKRLPMRWIAILYGQLTCSMAATTGIHNAEDVVKMIMCGADATMMASALLMKGPKHLETVLSDLEKWMEEYGYESIEQMKGSLSHKNTAEPAAFERANYIKLLQSFKLPHYPQSTRASW